MASELRVNTLKDASGNNSVATSTVAQGSAKAWIDYTTAATYVDNDSFNVSSLDDGGTGLATININADMATANYAVVHGTLGGLAGGTKVFQNGAKTKGAFSLYTTNKDGTPGDIGNTYAAVFGDLE